MGWYLNQDLRAVADPHLQIRGGPGHPDPDIRWVGAGVGVSGLKKKLFWPFGPQFGLKIRGGGRGGTGFSGSATERRWSCYGKLRELSSQESSHKLYGFTFITI